MLILEETLSEILLSTDTSGLKITDFHLGRIFNVIKLSDGSVGASMMYDAIEDHDEIIKLYKLLTYAKQFDPLLLDTLFKENTLSIPRNLKISLANTLVNALSQNMIEKRKNIEFSLFDELDYATLAEKNRIRGIDFKDDEWATVIGYGGLLEMFIKDTDIKNIHVSDMSYEERKIEIDSDLKKFEKYGKNISVSGAEKTKEYLEKSRVVSITGSALSNGSMEELLDMSKKCKFRIIQGESCYLYPKVLFEKYGVDLIISSEKESDIFKYIENDYAYYEEKVFEGHYDPKFIINNKRCKYE